jgi:hypothetical protein
VVADVTSEAEPAMATPEDLCVQQGGGSLYPPAGVWGPVAPGGTALPPMTCTRLPPMTCTLLELMTCTRLQLAAVQLDQC